MQLSLRDTGACVRKGAYEGRLRLQLGFDGLAFWQEWKAKLSSCHLHSGAAWLPLDPLEPLHAAILELPALADETPRGLAEHFLRQMVAIPQGPVGAVKYCQVRLNQGQWEGCTEEVRAGVVAALAAKLRLPAAAVAARVAALADGDVVSPDPRDA